MQQPPKITNRRIYQVFFLLCGLEALGLLTCLFLIPSDPKNSLLLGFSAGRLGIAAFLLFGGMACLALGSLPGRKTKMRMHLVAWLEEEGRLAGALPWLMGAGSLVGWLLIWTPAYRFGHLSAYYERLSPLILWLFLFCLQTFFLWIFCKKGAPSRERLKWEHPALRAAGVAAGVLLLLIFIIAVTRIGLTPDAIHWNDNGVPLKGEQVWLAFVIGLAGLLLLSPNETPAKNHSKHTGGKWLDLLIFLFVWLVSAGLWSGAPMVRSFFAPGPYPPGMVYYPFSDSVTYDLDAWHAIIGEGYAGGGQVDKPLYAFLLLIIHCLAGNDYTRIFSLQAGFLAILPALVYLIGRSIHSRPAGLAAATLVISRELNAYLSTTALSTSHSRLLLSEIPTAVMLTAFALCAAGWVRSDRHRLNWTAAAGGVLALTTLVRHNPWLFLPFVIAGVILAYGRQWRAATLQLAIFLAVFTATLVPWGIRTSGVIGNPFYVLGTFRSVIVQHRYHPDIVATSEVVVQDSRDPIGNYQEKSETYLGFMSEHFFHNLVANSLSLPTRFVYDDLSRLSNLPDSPQRADWDRSLPAARVVVLYLSLMVVAMGVGGAWKRYRWAGLVPLAVYLAYLLAAAVARTSGGRYIVPVEWALFLYYAVGFVEGVRWMGIWLGFRSLEWGVIDHSSIVRDPSPSKPLLVIVLIFLLAGISLPLSERLFPLRFPPQQPEEVMHFLTAQEVFKQAGLGDEEITSFLQQAGGRLAWGQALYPRFYEKDRGEPDQYNFLRIQSYPRLTLTLGNRTGGNVILPLQASPASFPDGSLVYVIGCPGFSSLDALAMLVLPPGGEPRLLERWPVTEWKCPLPAPVCDENRNCQ